MYCLVYDPTEDDKERERFWSDLDSIGNGYRLYVIRDLN